MLSEALERISLAIWSFPTVLVIAGTGIWFTVRMNFLQFTSLKDMQKAIKNNFFGEKGKNSFKAVSTALSATVGTGSVAGVATALTLGGAGAVFWLWVSAFFGMAVAYGEGVLSIKYRCGKKGGIMYAIRDGMGEKAAAGAYSLFTVFASFGMGSMAQSNSAAEALSGELSLSPAIIGAAFSLCAAVCLLSKKDLCRDICGVFMPIVSIAYIIAAVTVIAFNFKSLPQVFSEILASAFGFKQLAAGAGGYAVSVAITTGFKRGVFSNEAGLGTTAAIHAEGGSDDPHEQGLINMAEVFVDTFVVCTLTALAVLCSGKLGCGKDGAALVATACEKAFGTLSGGLCAISIAGFSLATVMGWSRIGLLAADYLAGGRKMPLLCYKLLYILSAFAGATLNMDVVWRISDIFNGLMIPPCMASLIFLRKDIFSAYDQRRPVEPKPFSPRSETGSESDSSTSGNIIGVTTSCAKRSPGSKV